MPTGGRAANLFYLYFQATEAGGLGRTYEFLFLASFSRDRGTVYVIDTLIIEQ